MRCSAEGVFPGLPGDFRTGCDRHRLSRQDRDGIPASLHGRWRACGRFSPACRSCSLRAIVCGFTFCPISSGDWRCPGRLLAFAATIALPATSSAWMIGDECVLVLLALLDAFVPHWLPVKRITSPARTFLMMNAASVAAMAVFFTSPDRFWANHTGGAGRYLNRVTL